MNRRDLLKGTATGMVALLVRPAFARAIMPSRPWRVWNTSMVDGSARSFSIPAAAPGWLGAAGSVSTFKLLLAGAVLKRVDEGAEHLDRHVVFGEVALLEYAPRGKTAGRATGMTIAPSGEAAVTPSDNTAAPLLVAAYYDNAHADAAAGNAVLAEVGRVAAEL